MKAVILAGGLGKRLRPFTSVLPKPLLVLGARSLLEHQIIALRDCGCSEVLVATFYKSEMIEAAVQNGVEFGIPIRISREEQPLGTAGALTLLTGLLSEPFLVVNGDILTDLNFRHFFEFGSQQRADLALATKLIATPFRFGQVLVDENNDVLDIIEKPEFLTEALAGIYYLTPAIASLIPSGQYYGMDELIRLVLTTGLRVSRYLMREYWIDIGQIEDYTAAAARFSDAGKSV